MHSFTILILAISSCPPTFARKSQLQKIDQISYIGELKKNRPDLIASDCKNNLILKLKYRKDVLTKKADYQKIIATVYTTENKAKDAIWSENFRAAARKFRELMEADFKTKGIKNNAEERRSLPYFVAIYDSAPFVGYQVNGPIDYDKQV